jgi:hypothetical protein
MGTLRYRRAGHDADKHPTDPRVQRYLYVFWHETLLVPATFKVRAHVLISQHADGEMIAQVCRHLRIGVVRGSTTRGGSKGLLEMLHKARHSHLAVTPDGPRGPRRRVQVGTIFLASHTGLPIVPLGLAYARAWRARSWDRFAIPQPWTTAHGVIGPTLHVPRGLDRAALEHYRRLLEERLLEATAAAERWAAGGPRPTVRLIPAIDALPRRASA